MLEARLQEAALLKRLLDSIKELVTDANFECNEEGINLQAMDNSHVALVAVKLDATGFKKYRCDRPMPLGVNLNSLTKVLKCAKDDDICIIKASDDADILNLVYEARSSDRIAEYDMKLMDIDAETLGIPDTEYDARVTMTASEFTRIVRDLSQLGESVRIEVSKEGVRFASEGEAANGNVLLKQTEAAREKYANYGKEDEEPKEEDDGDDDEEGSSSKKKIKKEKNMKKEDADVEMEGEEEDEDQEEFKPKSDDEGEEEQDEDEEDKKSSKKRKKAPAKSNGKPAKKVKKSDETPADGGVLIEMNQHVSLTFSLKYLVNFSKSSALSNTVQLMLSNDVPLLVSYKFGQGEIKYYLAPKIGEE
ncbi:proliferating cell nuclear antigen, N-terminal domain-containing protein [Suillus subalutaceus]|uniref:proliferating cell nuclear antigen, N-terminal domain-containing protein n=1 Tax=Suillus subalutaceus TaxID=48586 RepID=UPI001B880E0B|nr:proliferating cell nuclear antigen, N-terminal domain-containing protein [Suillus subalutaceus]KAG1857026.1 proliferating cell nuclear antigen, N-terminal domain-containing protein [Suillus subalutaceus]